jgi:hypothetical protein
MRLVVGRGELLTALGILSAGRLRRGTGAMPVWFSFGLQGQELRISEDRGKIAANVPASGAWPAAGATADLFMLRRGVTVCGEVIELYAVEERHTAAEAGRTCEAEPHPLRKKSIWDRQRASRSLTRIPICRCSDGIKHFTRPHCK